MHVACGVCERPKGYGRGHHQFDESQCDRCGRDNPVWSTPAEVWRAVYGQSGQPTCQGVLCPSCFVDDAVRVGLAGWVVSPEETA